MISLKDEIKEILEALKPQDEEFTKAGIKEYPLYLSRKQQDLLLDYITNLQEENEILKKSNENASKVCLAEHRYGVDKAEEARDYKSRNEKANWWLKEMLKQAKSDETKAIINGTLELLLNGGDEEC